MLAGLRSLPLQARLHRLRRPHLHRFRLLKCSFQSLRLHNRTLRSLWRARAGMHPFPPPLHQLRAQLLSRLRLRTWIPALFRQSSQRPLRSRLRALLREPWKQHRAEESSPAAKVPTEEVPLPSAQVEEASPTKAEPLRSCLLNFLPPQLLLYLTLRRLLPRRSQQQGRRRPLLTLPPRVLCPPALMTQIRRNQ